MVPSFAVELALHACGFDGGLMIIWLRGVLNHCFSNAGKFTYLIACPSGNLSQ